MSGKEKDNYETIKAQWAEFKKTLAYEEFLEWMDARKEENVLLATGPVDLEYDVNTNDGTSRVKLEFEPEKYAYLLQRNVGYDMIEEYVENYTTPD